MAFEKISFTLRRRYQQRPLAAAQIVAQAQKLIGKQARVIAFHEGSLRLGVANPVQAADLRLKSEKLIKKINRSFGKELVERLVFKLD